MVALLRERAPGEQLEPLCPVCQRPWLRAPSGHYVGHTTCQFSEELQDDLLDLLFLFPVPVRRVARDLGVPLHVLHKNLEAARRRRLARAPGGSR